MYTCRHRMEELFRTKNVRQLVLIGRTNQVIVAIGKLYSYLACYKHHRWIVIADNVLKDYT